MDIIKAAYLTKWYGMRYFARISGKRLTYDRSYAGTAILSNEDANALIAKAIQSKVPFMAGRFGANELNVMWRAHDKKMRWDVDSTKAMHHLHEGAGFFPETSDAGLQFAFGMREATKEIDLLAAWFNPMEDYEVKKWCRHEYQICRLRGIEPFFSYKPWTLALEGKRVLVIHPFSKTIQKQYAKRETLFSTPMLPEFELITQRAVQTIAGNSDDRFGTWFDALEYMYDEAMKREFDVAILGCGAYGFPLAAKIKKAGKVSIHLGGATQLLFGIRGSRWEQKSDYHKIMTDEWVRPSEDEKPQNAQSVENGCYW